MKEDIEIFWKKPIFRVVLSKASVIEKLLRTPVIETDYLSCQGAKG